MKVAIATDDTIEIVVITSRPTYPVVYGSCALCSRIPNEETLVLKKAASDVTHTKLIQCDIYVDFI